MHPLDRLRETRLLPVIVGLAIVAVTLVVMRIAHVLPPFIWAAITAYILYPVVTKLERALRIPRATVIASVYILLLGLLIFVGIRIVPSVMDQVRSLASSLPSLIDNARTELVREPEIRIGGFVIDTREIDARIDELAEEIAGRFGREAVPLVLHTVELIIKILVYLLATFYFLLHGDKVLRRLQGLAPHRHRDTVRRVSAQVNGTFGAYIRAQLLLFVIMSVATFIALTVLEVKYPLALAITTGALELIPIIGPWTAGTIAVMVAFSQGDAPYGWSPVQLAIVVGLTYFVLRMIEDHIVIPQLIGRIVRIHPVLVIFGVLAGASLGGVLGLLLAVPMLAVLKIISLAVVEELRHPPIRSVVTLREPGELGRFIARLTEHARQHVVLLIVPGATDWNDLEDAERLALEAARHDIKLQVVTPDPVAASITTAAGIEVVSRVRASDEAGSVTEELAVTGTDAPEAGAHRPLLDRLRARSRTPLQGQPGRSGSAHGQPHGD